MIAQVLQSGRASLVQLQTVYTMEDLYNIWEVNYTGIYNDWVRREREAQSARLRKGMTR